MSKVFICECGIRTTEIYIIAGVQMCAICAESTDPKLVDRRERHEEDRLRKLHKSDLQMRRWR